MIALGSLDTVDSLCRVLTQAAGCITISVGYALAPEHKFPAGIEDAIGATDWVFAHLDELRGDRNRVAIAGESSGGAFAASIPQIAKARNKPWSLVLQVLIYPVTDARAASASYQKFAEGNFLTLKKMRWFLDHYFENADQASDPLASPLLFADLSGLPPALIITADRDPLVDEGLDYASRLSAAGVPVESLCLRGWPHGFVYWRGSEAQQITFSAVIAALRRAFKPS